MNSKVSCSHIHHYKIQHGMSTYTFLNKKYLAYHSSSKRRASYFYCFFCRERGGRLHACMDPCCKFLGCFINGHMNFHVVDRGHMISMDLKFGNVFCHFCNDYMYDKEFERINNRLKIRSAIKMSIEVLSPRELQEEMDLIENMGLKKIHDKSIVGLRGLTNLGNTCYMNCILQVLAHTTLVREYFNSDRYQCPMEDPTHCLVCEMAVLFQEFYSGNPTPYSPTRLVYLMWTHAEHLSGYQQQDAHEFFLAILGVLHIQCTGKDPADLQPCDSNCNCFIGQIFKGIFQSETVCQGCKHVSRTYDPFMSISLNLGERGNEEGQGVVDQQAVSFLDCISRYIQSEYLEDAQCDNCASKSKTKQLTPKSVPAVTCFHLKRLEVRKKNEIYVNFPECLDMFPYMSYNNSTEPNESCENNDSIINENEYKIYLSAVVNHRGTFEGGHYISYIKHQNKWYKCDDNFVTLASKEEVFGSKAYLLFYEKQRDSGRPKGL